MRNPFKRKTNQFAPVSVTIVNSTSPELGRALGTYLQDRNAQK